MPAMNRICFACGYARPAWKGEDARVGRGVSVWLCRACSQNPHSGFETRKAAQKRATVKEETHGL